MQPVPDEQEAADRAADPRPPGVRPGDQAGDPLFAGVRVLDLAGSIGAYCSKLLADLGADVLKVEPPSGDPMRRKPPFADPGGSLLFTSYHVNKRGITLDVSRPDALPLLEAVGPSCDVVLLSPSARSPVAGFDRDVPALRWGTPQTIVAAITPFGLTGPWRDMRMTPFLSYAVGGQMHFTGVSEGPPLAAPGQLAWDEAGIHAAVGISAATMARGQVGGQVLDLAVHEVSAAKDFLLERFSVERPGNWAGRWESASRRPACGHVPTGLWPWPRTSATTGRCFSPCSTSPKSSRIRRLPIPSSGARSTTFWRR